MVFSKHHDSFFLSQNLNILPFLNKVLRALNKTLKFDLQKDDHDSFGLSRRIATQIFFKKHYEPNKFDFC